MGLSSSQARLLNLTGRMHQIEYKAAKLEAEKLQMANESTRVYEDYQNALEKTKIQVKTLNTDGSATYKDISSYDDLLNAGYAIQYNGSVYDGSSLMSLWNSSHTVTDAEIASGKYSAYGVEQPGTYTFSANYYSINGGSVRVPNSTADYAKLCHNAFGASESNPPSNVSEVITNLLNSGSCTLVQKRANGTYAKAGDNDFADYETSVATTTGLQEVADESELRKAEAKYEADMKRIDNKDKKYDYDLAALDNERNAIKQEMETLKTVAKDNVDRTFKLFS